VDALRAVPEGAFVLLVLREGELAAANLMRPIFRERKLRAVLLMSDAVYIAARHRAADLLDWASPTIEAPVMVPEFMVRSLRLLHQHFPGVAWLGDVPDALAALEATFPQSTHRVVPSPRDYAALVEALAAPRGWCVVPVKGEADGLRLRIALAASRRRGRVLAVGADVPGWPTMDAALASWLQLDEARMDGAVAARLDCELAAVQGVPSRSKATDLAAVSGRGSLPLIRSVIEAGGLRDLRRVRAGIARAALREGQTAHLHHVAAWTDRTTVAPSLESGVPRLLAAALPATLRLVGPTVAASRVANAMAWGDVSDAWGRAPGSVEVSLPMLMEPVITRASPSLVTLIDEAVMRRKPPSYGPSNAWAGVLSLLGRYDEAEGVLRESLRLKEDVLVKKDHNIGVSKYALAEVLEKQGRYDEAVGLLRESLSIFEETMGTANQSYVASLHTLAGVREKQGLYGEALGLLRVVLTMDEATVGTRLLDHGKSLHALADVLVKQERYDEAAGALRESLSIFGEVVGKMHPIYGLSLHRLAGVLEKKGRYDEAAGLLGESLSIKQETVGKRHPSYGVSLHALANVREEQGRYDEAAGLLGESLSIKEETMGKEHPSYAASLHALSGVLSKQGRYDEAAGLLGESLSIKEETVGKKHLSYGVSLIDLAQLVARGDPVEGVKLGREALEIFEEMLGTEHPNTQATRRIIMAM
jgi:tetratricopeptide (TPR) repeat protein